MQLPIQFFALAAGVVTGMALIGPRRGAQPIVGGRSNRHRPQPQSRRGVARVTVLREPADLYEMWQWNQVPTWLPFLTAVTPLADDRLRWSARLPGGQRLQWETESTAKRAGESLAWRSLPDAAVSTRGAVHFAPAPAGRGTEVVLAMHFDGTAGRLLALPALAGLCEGLRRFKQRAEAGEIASTAGQPSGRAPERQRPELRRAAAQLSPPPPHSARPLALATRGS